MRVAFTMAATAGVFAQAPIDPPLYIQLIRKPGTAVAPLRPYVNAQAGINVVGLISLTGLPETWMVESHYSWASIEDLDKRLAAAGFRIPAVTGDLMQDEVLAPARTILAAYRPSWSYRPDQAIRQFPRARYFQITVYRIRAGSEADFGELVRLRHASQETVNQDRPEIAYSVISGAPSGTFIFFAPILSLRALDDGVADIPAWAEGLADARAKARAKVAPESELTREHLLFRVEPGLSYVSEEFANLDRGFWRQ